VSLLIYAYAKLRELSRATPERYEGEDEILDDENVTGKEVLRFVNANKTVLREDLGAGGKDTVEVYQVLLNLVTRLEKSKKLRTFREQTSIERMNDAKVVEFDDKDAETELVYGITVNSLEKRITIVFRGSANIVDWAHNAMTRAASLENPLKDQPGQSQSIALHSGFAGKIVVVV
jgi:hypothetical protein